MERRGDRVDIEATDCLRIRENQGVSGPEVKL